MTPTQSAARSPRSCPACIAFRSRAAAGAARSAPASRRPRGTLICYTNSARTQPDDLRRILGLRAGEPGPGRQGGTRQPAQPASGELGSYLYNMLCGRLLRALDPRRERHAKGVSAQRRDLAQSPARGRPASTSSSCGAAGGPRYGGGNPGSRRRPPRRQVDDGMDDCVAALRRRDPVLATGRDRRSPMTPRSQWSAQAALWRDPAAAVSLHAQAPIDRRLLAGKARGDFWDLLQGLGITLLVGREYEHFVMALTVRDGKPFATYMPLPHPSGIAVDRRRGRVFIASTRNPNQIYLFRPLAGMLARKDRPQPETGDRPLMPVASPVLARQPVHSRPGDDRRRAPCERRRTQCDRAASTDARAGLVAALHRAARRAGLRPQLHPAQFDRGRQDARGVILFRFRRDLGTRFPGKRNYPVDGRGVIFSGATREPVVRGLTRPHSARLWRRRLWVNNSGYGEFGVGPRRRFRPGGAAARMDPRLDLRRRLRVCRCVARHSPFQRVRAGA